VNPTPDAEMSWIVPSTRSPSTTCWQLTAISQAAPPV
jgi:hypothetical protein